MRLVLLGPPGAGKGTQGDLLEQTLGVPHVATGDIIRDHISRRTPFGRMVEQAIAQGNFAPDADILYWVRQRLAQPDALRGYVLDGFPRDLAQAEAFEAPLDAVVELAISEDEVTERLAGRLICPTDGAVYHVRERPPRRPGYCDNDGTPLVRRPDDEPGAVHHRLKIYEDRTLPLRGYYRRRGLLRTVDAAGSAEAVLARILQAVGAHKKETV